MRSQPRNRSRHAAITVVPIMIVIMDPNRASRISAAIRAGAILIYFLLFTQRYFKIIG